LGFDVGNSKVAGIEAGGIGGVERFEVVFELGGDDYVLVTCLTGEKAGLSWS